jgi:sec-independent protein translocase protein TatA
MVFGELLGPDMLIILGILVLLFGSTQLPKLARSLGSAKTEFEKGIHTGADTEPETTPPVAPVAPRLMTRSEVEQFLVPAPPHRQQP